MNRRTVLKGGIVLAATAHTAAGAPDVPTLPVSIDDFLARSTAAEKVRYHSNALAEAMNDLSPASYLVRVDIKKQLALVISHQMPK